MFIYLQIFNSIIGLQDYIIEKIQNLVSIYYYLKSNNTVLLYYLSNKHTFLDLNLDKIQNFIILFDEFIKYIDQAQQEVIYYFTYCFGNNNLLFYKYK